MKANPEIAWYMTGKNSNSTAKRFGFKSLKKLMENLPAPEGGAIVDLGCGYSDLSQKLLSLGYNASA